MADKTFPHSLYVLLIQSGMPEGLTTEQQTKWLHRHLRGLHEQNADLLDALREITDRYCELVNSGDAGFWNPELEHQVKNARAAIAKAEGE